MKTIAVGPFELIESCVTGGTTDATLALCCPYRTDVERNGRGGRLRQPVNTVRDNCATGLRRGMLMVMLELWCHRDIVFEKWLKDKGCDVLKMKVSGGGRICSGASAGSSQIELGTKI